MFDDLAEWEYEHRNDPPATPREAMQEYAANVGWYDRYKNSAWILICPLWATHTRNHRWIEFGRPWVTARMRDIGLLRNTRL
jgi:hypothetical protein